MKRRKSRPQVVYYTKSFFDRIKDSVLNILLIAVCVMGTLHYVGWKSENLRATKLTEKSPLSEKETRRLIVDVIAQYAALQKKNKDGKTETKVYNNVRKVVATQLDDGSVKVKIPKAGFTFEPGLSVHAADRLRLGVDIQYAYWKQWGLIGGLSVLVEKRTLGSVRGHAGLSYSFPYRYLATSSIFAGIDTSGDPIVGLRTRF